MPDQSTVLLSMFYLHLVFTFVCEIKYEMSERLHGRELNKYRWSSGANNLCHESILKQGWTITKQSKGYCYVCPEGNKEFTLVALAVWIRDLTRVLHTSRG